MPSSAPRSPWDYLDAFPPPYCRLLGKEPGGGTGDMAISAATLAIRAEIPLERIWEICHEETWDDVSTGEMRRFFKANNFDPTNAVDRARVSRYETVCQQRKSTPFCYLRRSPKWETEFLPLLLLAARIMKSKNGLLPTSRTAGLAKLS